MPVSGDTRQALKLLERIRLHLQESEAAQLSPSVGDDLNTLISVLDSPVFNSILNVQDSIQELKRQLHKHPSILPVDFDISPTTGELLLNVPAEPIPLQNSDSYDQSSDAEQNYDYESHGKSVGSAKMNDVDSRANEHSSMIAAPPEYALSAITTESYAEEFQRTIDQGAQGREIHTLQLFKPEGSSLGFSVVGLRSEQKGELGIFIQEIQPTGIAGRDGRLSEGDQILAIDGQPLDSNISHQQAISILQQARGLVELIVARGGIPPATATLLERSPSDASKGSSSAADMVLNTEWAQVESIDLLNDGSGLGFGIIGGKSTGVVVKTILPGGVADRDGRLQSGDHILQIGSVNLRGMGSEQVAMVLRQSGARVRLIVARPVDPAASPPLRPHAAPLVPTRILADPEEVERHLALFPVAHEPDPYRGPPCPEATFAYQRELDYPPQVGGYSSSDGRDPDLEDDQPEMETFEVELVKDQQGLGITIAGYVCEKEEISGIFVKSIAKGSAADMCSQIRVNDQIIEVDGRPLHGYTNHDAVEVLRSTGKIVKLRLARYLRGAKYQQLQLAIASGELSYPSLPTIQALVHEPKSPYDAGSSKDVDVSDVNVRVEGDYEGPLNPRVEEAIIAKWSKIMGPEYEIVVAQLSKFREGGGLGISLEGTVDVEDGQEVRPHHYIRSILPDGPVGTNATLRSGDELLEVNGKKLLGMDHHGVVGTLKELPLHVRMVCARHAPDSAPYPAPDLSRLDYDLSSPPEFAGGGRCGFGGSLTSLTHGCERLVKAKSDGSLAVGGSSSSPPSDSALSSRLKSRSLEPLTGLAMWSSEPQIIELVKGDRGLGFSILDYQDPMNPNETVIVIRSLVPGGVAQQDGRLIPGDRLLFVNDTNLENASLDAAVQALKGAPKGAVRIGVAKPLPLPEQQMEHSPIRPDAKASFDLPPFFPRLSLDLEQISILKDIAGLTVSPSVDESDKRNSGEFQLSPINTIKIQKGADVFGLSVNIVDSVGVVVTSVTPGSACDKDGRLRAGDVLVSVDDCSLLVAEPRLVGEVLRNVDKSTSDVVVRYITEDVSDNREVEVDSLLEPSPETGRPAGDNSNATFPNPFLDPAYLQAESDLVAEVLESIEDLKNEFHVEKSDPSKEDLLFLAAPLRLETRISPVQLHPRPTVPGPRPSLLASRSLDVSGMVSRVKPTVPFKPHRSSLTSRDGFPARDKSKAPTIESFHAEDPPGPPSPSQQQWGPERVVELVRDPSKGLGISIVSGKPDVLRGGVFIKNVLPDSPAGWNGIIRRGDRILEVNSIDIRNASHTVAVDVIKKASNPVQFVIQNLVPWNETETTPNLGSPSSEKARVSVALSDTKVTPPVKPKLPLPPHTASPTPEETAPPTLDPAPRHGSSSPPGSPPRFHEDTPASAKELIPEEKEEADEVCEVPPEGKVLSKAGKMIDVTSAANVKLNPSEKLSDLESEDEFGYTLSK